MKGKIELTKFLNNEKPFIFTLYEKDDIAAVRYTFYKIINKKVSVTKKYY